MILEIEDWMASALKNLSSGKGVSAKEMGNILIEDTLNYMGYTRAAFHLGPRICSRNFKVIKFPMGAAR
jgi:hypothetical protein